MTDQKELCPLQEEKLESVSRAVELLSRKVDDLQNMLLSNRTQTSNQSRDVNNIISTVAELQAGYKLLKDAFGDLKKETSQVSRKIDEVKCIINEKLEKLRDEYIRKSDLKFYFGVITALFAIIQYLMLKVGVTPLSQIIK